MSSWDKVKPLYSDYGETIAPLIALIEVRYGAFPVPMLNELRAFTTHIARIAGGKLPSEEQESQIRQASRHILRIKLDLYKYLALWYYDEYQVNFFSRYQSVYLDGITVNGTKLMVLYYKHLNNGKQLIDSAKQLEIHGPAEESLDLYRKAIEHFEHLDKLVQSNSEHIAEAKRSSASRVTMGHMIAFGVGIGASLVASIIFHFATK